ncbi:regulator of G-protein signaling 7-binding protein A [Parasteatoda tepidariorum]|uniref:regulator of G-protein signaling 7-binding protein A n=1 Tax=Parasteatoda tepidariorum TaxID=114398 RepID=UPI00077F9512|nr:uncharacterized protein LOC107442027 [Parasteatoda tepidariorum]
MASTSEGLVPNMQDNFQDVVTTEQPKQAIKQVLFRKNRIEVRAKEESSWCQSIPFFGRRRSKRIVSEFVEEDNSECVKVIKEFNNALAVFRDHLVHIAKQQDGPEIRDRIRETRRKCLELCVSANDIIMPQIKSDVADGIPVDSQQLVNLVCCTQLFVRELHKCQNLVQANPMDMTAFYEKKPRSSGVSVLDRLVLFKIQPRDYHKEELQSITRDVEKITDLLKEMKEFMPCEGTDKLLLDENFLRWNKRARKNVCRFAEDWICYCGSNLA